jgi:hypothetical protein
MRRLLLLLSTLVFQLNASHLAYNSDSSLDDRPSKLNLRLNSIDIEDDRSEHSSDDHDKLTIVENNIGVARSLIGRSPDSQVSSLTTSSPELTKFAHYSDDLYRPRGSSFNSHSNSVPKHVSFGWIQFSDDRWMPSENMEDTEENRRHILTMMVADARHNNLEYFKYLAGVLESFETRNPSNSLQQHHELDIYNPYSLIFAAAHSDNTELFCEVMEMKGITFEDLNPFHKLKKKNSPKIQPRKKSAFYSDEASSDDDQSVDEDDLINAEDTVFGQAVIKNSISIVKLLLDHGIRDEFSENTCTFLHLAVLYGHEILVRILIERGGSEIDRVDGALMSPLMIAIQAGHYKIVRLLLKLDASMFITDFKQRNCFHYALECENKHLRYLKSFHKHFMQLTKRNKQMLVDAMDVYHKIPLDYTNDAAVYQYFFDNFMK